MAVIIIIFEYYSLYHESVVKGKTLFQSLYILEEKVKNVYNRSSYNFAILTHFSSVERSQ